MSQDIMEHGRFWVTVLKGEFRYQINHRLHLIQAPTLLVNGETDWHREGEDRILKGIKGARMEIIPRSGGIPAFEQPEAHTKVVLDFLRASE